MITFLIGTYRAFPWRSHCDRRAGIHTCMCRIIRPLIGDECDFPAPPKR